MTSIKKILISAVIALIILLISTGVLNIITNKDVIQVPVLSKNLQEGLELDGNVIYLEIKLNGISKDILENIVKKEELNNLVASRDLLKGEILLMDKIISKDEYLIKMENLEYISLPIKDATEGVAYKLKKGDKINVYYTAKKRLVDGLLNNKTKVYSTNKEETLVTCLLEQDVEVISLTNNMGLEVTDGTATNIIIRLPRDKILEITNLKEQGIFTYSLV